jgi:hypothetical protein
MSVEDKDKIDAISLSGDGSKVMLTITYHLDWTEDSLYKLQEKLNTYLSFIESGEMLEAYPQSEGKYIAIEVVYSEPLDERGLQFVEQAKPILDEAGYELIFTTVDDIKLT